MYISKVGPESAHRWHNTTKLHKSHQVRICIHNHMCLLSEIHKLVLLWPFYKPVFGLKVPLVYNTTMYFDITYIQSILKHFAIFDFDFIKFCQNFFGFFRGNFLLPGRNLAPPVSLVALLLFGNVILNHVLKGYHWPC